MLHNKRQDPERPYSQYQVKPKDGAFSRRKLLAGAASLAAASAVGGVAAGQSTTLLPRRARWVARRLNSANARPMNCYSVRQPGLW